MRLTRSDSGEQELTLHGWSLGGMFTLFYSALSKDQHVRNAIILGAPIDSHASGILGFLSQGLGSAADFVHKHTGHQVHDLRPHWFHSPGWLNTIGFKLTNPIGSVMGYWELVIRLGDREFVSNHATTAAFLDRMVAYPGGIVQDTVVRIWMGNELSQGTVQIGDDKVRLNNISANIFAIAGSEDTMVTPGSAKRLMDHVSSEDKTFRVTHGGHMGILSGSKAPRESWLEMAEWLAERSD